MISLTILSTGSDGNSYILTTDNPVDPTIPRSIMVDCGVSNTVKKCTELGVDINDIYAICITHAHSDHVSSIKPLTNKMSCAPLICGSEGELHSMRIAKHLPQSHLESLFQFEEGKNVSEMMRIGNFAVVALRADHDTDEPVHYFVSDGSTAVFVSCDNCKITDEILGYMRESNCVLLEANYSRAALESDYIDGKEIGREYDLLLKNRIALKGHTSNDSARKIMEALRGYVKHVVLIHPSKFYNSYNTMVKEIDPDSFYPDMNVTVAFKSRCPIQLKI